MTEEQRAVLRTNIDNEGSTYVIVTIEYPCYSSQSTLRHDNLKICTRQIEGDIVDVDVYDVAGQTIENRSYFARLNTL